MTREQLRTIFEGLDNVTDAMLNSVMALHGQSIKAVRDELAAEKTQLATVSAELEKMKATPDKSAELQTKLDELQKKYDASRYKGSPSEPGSFVLSRTLILLTVSGIASIRCLAENGL